MSHPTQPPAPLLASSFTLFGLSLLAWAGPALAAGPAAASAPAAASTPAVASAPAAAAPASAAAKKAPPITLIDINSASRAQLKTLPGIGDAEAGKIIASRPYLSKADLATRNVIPTGVYLSLKNRIIAIQKTSPKGKA